VPLEFALGKDRQNVVEFLDLPDLDALQDPALGGEFGLPAFDVGDVDRIGLGDEAIDGSGGVEVLHRHLEAEILGGLVTDRLHHGVGHADMAQFDILDLLRPDRREAADRVRSSGGPGDHGRPLQQRAAAQLFLPYVPGLRRIGRGCSLVPVKHGNPRWLQ